MVCQDICHSVVNIIYRHQANLSLRSRSRVGAQRSQPYRLNTANPVADRKAKSEESAV